MDKKREVDLQKLAKRVSELDPREKYEYITKLKEEIKLHKANLKVKEALVDKYDSIPDHRYLNGLHVMAGIFAYPVLGVIVMGLGLENFTPEELTYLEVVKGVGLGYATALINGIAYENKPVSNKVNDFRKYLNNKKIARLEDKIERKTYLEEQLDEMEK